MRLKSLLHLREHRAELALQEVGKRRQELAERIRAERAIQRELQAVRQAKEQLNARLRSFAANDALHVREIGEVHERRQWLNVQEAKVLTALQRAQQEVLAAHQRLSEAAREYRLLLAKKDAAQTQIDLEKKRQNVMAEYRNEIALEEFSTGAAEQ